MNRETSPSKVMAETLGNALYFNYQLGFCEGLIYQMIDSIDRVRESMKSGDIKAVTRTLRAEIGERQTETTRQERKDDPEGFDEVFERELNK